MKRFLGLTVLAVILIAICLQAASWQYDRHVKRSTYNSLIEANLDRPLLQEAQLASLTIEDISWRELQLTGNFEPRKEILVRNRYNNGE